MEKLRKYVSSHGARILEERKLQDEKPVEQDQGM